MPKFVSDIKELEEKQRHDISRAFCGTPGLYTVKDEYAQFAVGAEFWKLDQSERKKYLNKVSEVPLISLHTRKSLLQPIGLLPQAILVSEVSSMKVKVERILDGKMRLIGFSGPKSCIVSGDSGTEPHSVSAVGIHKYTCDASCMQFKSYIICSHTLAAAADNRKLQEFVDAYLSGNIPRNVTTAATAGGTRWQVVSLEIISG